MILVGAAMFISVAMRKTGLDRRIAMMVLSSVGTKVSRIYLGVIITGSLSLLSLFQVRRLVLLAWHQLLLVLSKT